MSNDEARKPTEAPPVECRNCGEPLLGPYCHTCGQSRKKLHRSLRAILSEAAGDLWSYDSRFVRTIRVLLFQPGRLSQEFLIGRRVRHVGPFRLYLIFALVYFALFATVDNRYVNIQIGVTQTPSTQLQGLDFLDRTRIVRGGVKLLEEPGRFERLLVSQIPRAFFLLVPFHALLLWLAFRSTGYYYVEQLVVSLHLHSFAFFLFSIAHLLGAIPHLPRVLEVLLLAALGVWGAVYLWRAIRRVEGLSIWSTLWRLVGVTAVYLPGVVGAILVLVLGLFWWAGGE